MNSKVRHMGEVTRCVRVRLVFYCKLYCKKLLCRVTLRRHRDINRPAEDNICLPSVCLSFFRRESPETSGGMQFQAGHTERDHAFV